MENYSDFVRKKISGYIITHSKNRIPEVGVFLEKHNDEYLLTISVIDAPEYFGPSSFPFDRAWETKESHFTSNGQYNSLLPRTLCEDKLSMTENKERATVSFAFKVTTKGKVSFLGIKPTMFKVKKVYNFYKGDLALQGQGKDFECSFFKSLEELAKIVRNLRKIPVFVPSLNPKSGAYISDSGEMKYLQSEEQYLTFIYWQEILTFANIHIAKYCHSNEIPVFFLKSELKCDIKDKLINEKYNAKNYLLDVMPYVDSPTIYHEPAPYWACENEMITSMFSPLNKYADLVNYFNIRSYLTKNNYPFPMEELDYWAEETEQGLIQIKKIKNDYNLKKLKGLFSIEEENAKDYPLNDQKIENDNVSSLLKSEKSEKFVKLEKNISSDKKSKKKIYLQEREIVNLVENFESHFLDVNKSDSDSDLNNDSSEFNIINQTEFANFIESVHFRMDKNQLGSHTLYEILMNGRKFAPLKPLALSVIDHCEKQSWVASQIVQAGKVKKLWQKWFFDIQPDNTCIRLVIDRGNGGPWSTENFVKYDGTKKSETNAATYFVREFFNRKLIPIKYTSKEMDERFRKSSNPDTNNEIAQSQTKVPSENLEIVSTNDKSLTAENPFFLLNKLFQKKVIDRPDFVFTEEVKKGRPNFICTLNVKSEGKSLVFTGAGSNKKIAKNNAIKAFYKEKDQFLLLLENNTPQMFSSNDNQQISDEIESSGVTLH